MLRATILLACALWGSRRAHLVYLLAIFACCVWNGGSYYIEVFSHAYRRQFEAVDEAAADDELAVLPPISPGAVSPTGAEEADEYDEADEREGGGAGDSTAESVGTMSMNHRKIE